MQIGIKYTVQGKEARVLKCSKTKLTIRTLDTCTEVRGAGSAICAFAWLLCNPNKSGRPYRLGPEATECGVSVLELSKLQGKYKVLLL